MPKLLQINTVVNYGATGRIAEEIGQVAISHGWQSYIAYGKNVRKSASTLIKIGTDYDLYAHAIKTRIFDLHGFGSTNATRTLIKKIEKLKPDVIHLGNLHGYYINIQVLFQYLKTAGIPVIWTFYDCWPLTGHCTYFDFVGCDKWKTVCNACPQKTEYPSSLLIDRSRRNFNSKKELFTSLPNLTILSNSEWLSNIIKQSFFINYQVKVINSGVDINVFSPKEAAQSEVLRLKYDLKGKFVCLGVSINWPERKGFSDFLKLSILLDKTIRIFLIGLTNKQIDQLPDNIVGIARTENVEELAALYSMADVFVNPTWEDNFPTTKLEALASGTPVITYNTGGSIESVSSETGMIVEKGDIQGLADAITITKKKEKQFYSKKCRETALQKYNKADRFGDYIKLYQGCIKKTISDIR